MESLSKRIKSVDVAKGIGIISVIYGHCVVMSDIHTMKISKKGNKKLCLK